MKKHVYCCHNTLIDVPFFDVDSMNIAWHGHYVKYLEIARCDFLSSIGYDYTEMARQGYGWPIVKMNLKYIKPAVFGQKIRVQLMVREIESCLRVDYELFDAQTNQRLTKASTTQVAVWMQTGEMQFQTPSGWLDAVKTHPGFQAA